MQAFAENLRERVSGSGILVLDDDLEPEARTVLSQSPEPQNEFEVAVVLETLGYTDTSARTRGYRDLFDLARHLNVRLGECGLVRRAGLHSMDAPDDLDRGTAKAIAAFLGYSLPWLAAVFLFLATGAGLWSAGGFTTSLGSAMTLALVVGLVSSALFTFPFARRVFLYRSQESCSLAGWTARWILGAGAVGCVAIAGLVYVVLGEMATVSTPTNDKVFLEMAVGISLFQLSLTPLYTVRAFGWLAGVVGAGIVSFALGLADIAHGAHTSPLAVIDVQLVALAAMIAVACVGSTWVLRSDRRGRVSTPRLSAVVRSTASYGIYGAGYFSLALATQLVAAGIWHGSFRYSETYGAVTGMALIALLPLLGYTTIVGDRFQRRAFYLVRSVTLVDADHASRSLVSSHRRSLVSLTCLGLATSVSMICVIAVLRNDVRAAAIAWANAPLFVLALVSYVAIAVGVLNSQSLFALSRPLVPTVGAVLGSALCLGIAGSLAPWLSDISAASLGMLVGTVTYGVLTAAAALRALKQYDRACYASL